MINKQKLLALFNKPTPAKSPTLQAELIRDYLEDETANIHPSQVIPPIPAAVLIPIIEHANQLTALFTERTSHLKHHPGQISFPGGGMTKQDIKAIDTALRETEEEIGIAKDKIQVLGELAKLHTSSGYLVTPIVGLIQPPLELRLDPFEVTTTFEVPLDFLLAPNNRTRKTVNYQGKQRSFYAITYNNKYIWGVTAAIVVDLAERLVDLK